MKLQKIGRVELIYSDVDVEAEYPEGGQVYGILTGSLEAGKLRGTLHATNVGRQRPDESFAPALRGVLTTEKGVQFFFTMDGVSIRKGNTKPIRRTVTTGITLWTADPSLRSWNDAYLLAEMEGGKMKQSWGVKGSLYLCVPEI